MDQIHTPHHLLSLHKTILSQDRRKLNNTGRREQPRLVLPTSRHRGVPNYDRDIIPDTDDPTLEIEDCTFSYYHPTTSSIPLYLPICHSYYPIDIPYLLLYCLHQNGPPRGSPPHYSPTVGPPIPSSSVQHLATTYSSKGTDIPPKIIR